MKHIPLKTLDAPDNSPPIEYADVLREVVRRPLNRAAGYPDRRDARQSSRYWTPSTPATARSNSRTRTTTIFVKSWPR